MDYNKEFPNLSYLLGYFPQGWIELYSWGVNKPNFENIIRKFKTQDQEEMVLSALNETKKLLSLNLSENHLENFIDEETTSGYSPYDTHREFFEKILEILEEPQEETMKHFIPEFNIVY